VSARRLRVGTLNVLGPANPDWSRRLPVLAGALRALDADVLALQEVPATDADRLEQLTGPGYSFAPHGSTSADGIGAVLATRLPVRSVAEVDLHLTPRTLDFPWCAAVLVTIETPVGVVLVAHHKPSWQFGFERERELQAVAAARAIDRAADGADHVVVLGDFDAGPEAQSLRFWCGRTSLDGMSVAYQDAWETCHPTEAGFTFSAENPLVRDGEVATALSRRIDHVLVRSGVHGPSLQVARCERVLDRAVDGVWASDHFGVVADLVLPAHAPGTWAREPQRHRAL
jgi:endonuclease/exonuclease/phosphatase family metal-dependent hydrolase